MKKGFVAITAAIAIAASSLVGSALAGIGPLRGLPDVNPANTTNGYVVADTAVPGLYGSVLCVACHTRNPAAHTTYRATNGNRFQATHFVTRTFADTSEGGGYDDHSVSVSGKTRATRLNLPLYMAQGTVSGWATLPKYGRLNGTEVDNNDATAYNPNTMAAQMICESCHNVVKNIGAAKLLAPAFANGGTYALNQTALVGNPGDNAATLCVGCHGRMDSGISAEWKLHPAATWTGTHHHRNTGTATYYGTGTASGNNMGGLSRGMYEVAGVQLWGASFGEITATTDRALTYDSGANKKMIGTAALGAPMPSATYATTSQIQVNTNGNVTCTNCHRAHNAESGSGATILMTRSAAEGAIGASTLAPTLTDNTMTAGVGIRGRANHIQNTNQLCLACHQ